MPETENKLAAKSEASTQAHKYENLGDQFELLAKLAESHPLADLGYSVQQNPDNGAAVVLFGQDNNVGLVLRAAHRRFWTNGSEVKIGRPWATESDVEQLCSVYQSPEQTQRNAFSVLDRMRNGQMPDELTRGTEIEGTIYHWNNERQEYVPANVTNSSHPELLFGTWETAIKGYYPTSVVGYAQALSRIYLEAQQKNPDSLYVLSDVVEGGRLEDAQENDNGYVQLMIEFLKQVILAEEAEMPEDTRTLYASLIATVGVDTLEEFFESQGLIWPSQAHHNHFGIPRVLDTEITEDVRDASLALAMRAMLHTRGAGVITALTGSSERVYGNYVSNAFKNEDLIKVQSVRSIMRRMFSTARGGRPIRSFEEENPQMINELLQGDIHSAARYPSNAQHGGSRSRPEIRTNEFTDKNQHPDFLTLCGSHSASFLISVIGIEAKASNPLRDVYDYCQQEYGNIFAPQYTDHASDSQMQWEARFNRDGLEAKDNQGKKMSEYVGDLLKVFYQLQAKYPALKEDARLASAWLLGCLETPISSDLRSYFGINEQGFYDPSMPNRGLGLISNYKRDLVTQELLEVQAHATFNQALEIESSNTHQTLELIMGNYLNDKVNELWRSYEAA